MPPDLQPVGKLLLGVGAVLLIVGALILFARDIPFLGKLPGDIHVQKKNFTIYFPITTCILLSILLSLALHLFSKK